MGQNKEYLNASTIIVEDITQSKEGIDKAVEMLERLANEPDIVAQEITFPYLETLKEVKVKLGEVKELAVQDMEIFKEAAGEQETATETGEEAISEPPPAS